jgi:hypothetical protein
MRDKRYLPEGELPPGSWKAVVDAAVASRDRLLSVTPSSIEGVMARGLDWLARVQGNQYERSTPYGSFTPDDAEKLIEFQKTKCGIRFPT